MQSVRFFLHDWAMQLRCGVPVLIALNGCLMVAQEERLRAAISALFECARDGGSIPVCGLSPISSQKVSRRHLIRTKAALSWRSF